MANAKILDGLNPVQQEAAQYLQGPLLIVAGPGSGKTRVIIHRIAYLVKVVGISPFRICAVTFTNRAAREIRSRLGRLLGMRSKELTASTFHALCARILRQDGQHIGLQPDFGIYDDYDQRTLLKQTMLAVGVDDQRFPLRSIQAAISSAKSKLVDPESYLLREGSYFDEIVQRLYVQYQELLSKNNAVDFDDLLMKVVLLFQEVPEVLHKYQNRYTHLLIDEFQDTNMAQYNIGKLLAGKYRNICVVGDPDQAIYSWRNADLRNILSFQRDYPDAKVFNLSQNYRSTRTILEAAHALISLNQQRLDKELWTTNHQGAPIVVGEGFTGEAEALMIIREAKRLRRDDNYSLRDCAIMYRVNAQSRAFEEACLRYGVPYKLVGGVRFYQRQEIKDVLAYLRILLNPYDNVSLARVINTPPRGIGQKTMDELRRWAQSQKLSLYAAIQAVADEKERDARSTHSMGPRAVHVLINFLHLINNVMEHSQQASLVGLIDMVLEHTGYMRYIQEATDDRADERVENILELRDVARDYAGHGANAGLQAFLEGAALMSEQDVLDGAEESDYLTLITLHQAKGLEFPVVFVTGLEDGVLPHARSFDDMGLPIPAQMEEERRLCYVGMTRAMQRLYLTRAFHRSLWRKTRPDFMGGAKPSCFLSDIPEHLITVGTWESGESVRRRVVEEASGRRATTKNLGQSGPLQVELLRDGELVRHAKFGEGVVVSCKPSGTDYEVTVAFKGKPGIKRLMLSYAPLEKV